MDPPMGADVGVFQVADAPTYGYFYTLPKIVSLQRVSFKTLLDTINLC